MWRLAVVEKVATLQEIESTWTLCDVLTANEVLDAYYEALPKPKGK